MLKKLCIHVFKLINEGSSQDSVIGQKLNIVDLFERDIADLTAEQHACLKEIALNSPADYFRISEIYNNDVVQGLINDRLIIRRASKLTLYWDIFRDYVLNKSVPKLLLDYIPQQQFSTVVRIPDCLLLNGSMSSLELSQKTGMNVATIDNTMIDAVMFGTVKSNNIAAQVVLQNYMFERFLARMSKSEYCEKFVIKDGMLIAAIVGLDTRSTMDLDTTLKM